MIPSAPSCGGVGKVESYEHLFMAETFELLRRQVRQILQLPA
jgi:hypothetical protein